METAEYGLRFRGNAVKRKQHLRRPAAVKKSQAEVGHKAVQTPGG